MYDSVLVALDREDPRGAAILIERAARLGASGAEVTFATVRLAVPPAYSRLLPEGAEAQDRRESEGWLRGIATDERLQNAKLAFAAPAGPVARELAELARDLGVECILVGAHRTDLARRLLGSNAQAIIRDAPCDVILVRLDRAERD